MAPGIHQLTGLPVASGRMVRLSDWREQKEREEFRALCNRLRVRKWYAQNRARKLAYMRSYFQRTEVAERERERLKKRRAA